MPYKDPKKMAEYMRKKRAIERDKVNVNPLTQNVNPSVNPETRLAPKDISSEEVSVNPVNLSQRASQVSGEYENGYWVGICPGCNHHNRMDPKKSFRPADKCEHFQQLRIPGKPSEFVFKRSRLTSRVNVNPLTQNVNPKREEFLLSYSRNKYQFVLYSLDDAGKRSIIRSYSKKEWLEFGPYRIQLTWGPEEVA